jgi:hypothetical protein
MSIEDLPKHIHGGVRLTKAERKRLEEWVIREGWTREKTIKKQFRYDNSMPTNLAAPGVPSDHWSRDGKCICVMCGYVTTSTNICRHCVELPADEVATRPVYCYVHKTPHRDSNNEKWTMHRSIVMVAVS